MPKYLNIEPWHVFHPFLVSNYRRAFEEIYNSDQKIIPIIINSYGGYVDGLTPLLDMIDESDKPVLTIISGVAMSCGAILSASGTKSLRFMGKNSRFMIHQVSGFTWGKSSEMLSDAQESERLTNELCYKRLDKAANKPDGFTKNLVKEKFNADWFLSADEAISHGYIDKIGSPVQILNNLDEINKEYQLLALAQYPPIQTEEVA